MVPSSTREPPGRGTTSPSTESSSSSLTYQERIHGNQQVAEAQAALRARAAALRAPAPPQAALRPAAASAPPRASHVPGTKPGAAVPARPVQTPPARQAVRRRQ
jgi:hypothetical protein